MSEEHLNKDSRHTNLPHTLSLSILTSNIFWWFECHIETKETRDVDEQGIPSIRLQESSNDIVSTMGIIFTHFERKKFFFPPELIWDINLKPVIEEVLCVYDWI